MKIIGHCLIYLTASQQSTQLLRHTPTATTTYNTVYIKTVTLLDSVVRFAELLFDLVYGLLWELATCTYNTLDFCPDQP